ncbi:MAG: hypothetical protein QOJ19_2079, partial [Acidimicrobiia bacterium]|nr:hypothetical protein [Acidimicrobiia bacterium]
MLFVSYSRTNRDEIGLLRTDLRALGHSVWLDEELSGGQLWWDEILSKIRQCDAFLFVVSPSSVASEACLLELNYAIAVERIIIPLEVIATELTELPSSLAAFQLVSYQQGDKTDSMALARALAHTGSSSPLPDPLPPVPPVPGSYLATIRDQINSREPLNLDQQLGLVHRLGGQADHLGREHVVPLLLALRDRDDVFAAVADQIDALQRSLQLPPPGRAPRFAPLRHALWGPRTLLDRVTLVLALIAVVAGALAMAGSVWEVGSNGSRSWGGSSVGLQRWHLALLLVAFSGLLLVSFVGLRTTKKVAGLAVLVVALFGLVGWWWRAGIVRLLLQQNVGGDSGPVKLGLG